MIGDNIQGDLYYTRCDGVLPTLGWNTQTQITTGGIYSWPRIQIDPITLRVWVLTECGSSTIQTCYSDDDGYSFSSLTTLSSSQSQFPVIEHNQNGDMLRGWVQGNQVTLQYRSAGNTDQNGTDLGTGNINWGSSYNPTTVSTGTILQTTTSFSISEYGIGDYWLISVVGLDQQTVTTYFSIDNCVTFSQLGSSYTDSASSFHVRMSTNSDGAILRSWLRGDSSIGLQLFDSNLNNWHNVVQPSMNGSQIFCNQGGWGHCEWSSDYSDQVSMSIVLQGTQTVSYLSSVDGGSTFNLISST